MVHAAVRGVQNEQVDACGYEGWAKTMEREALCCIALCVMEHEQPRMLTRLIDRVALNQECPDTVRRTAWRRALRALGVTECAVRRVMETSVRLFAVEAALRLGWVPSIPKPERVAK